MSDPDSNLFTTPAHTDWRSACRALAQTRAHAEALHLWALPPDTPVPFEHRWEHVQEVVRLALHLVRALRAAGDMIDEEIVEAAAWLHDIRKMEPQHALAGAAEAQTFLPGTNFPPHKIAAVVDAIARHEGFYRAEGAPPIAPLEAAVLWDADKLSKLGVGALVTSIASPYAKGMTLAQRRAYVDTFARDVLAKTVTSMNTEIARAQAAQRYAVTLQLLDAWAGEERE